MSSTPVYAKTDKSHVMANVLDAAQKVIGQTEERGAVPLLYAATAPEMSGKHLLCLVCCCNSLSNFILMPTLCQSLASGYLQHQTGM